MKSNNEDCKWGKSGPNPNFIVRDYPSPIPSFVKYPPPPFTIQRLIKKQGLGPPLGWPMTRYRPMLYSASQKLMEKQEK